MARTILCPVNETDGAAQALRVAARLCERLAMRLVVVHIADGVPPSPTARREARRRGEWLTARILAEQGVPNVDRRVAIGTPGREIAGIAEQEQPEMIIIGSKRQGRRPQRSLRSRLASELAELTPFPVLIVPPAVPTAVLHPTHAIV